jgi:hypothetical protein
MLKGRTANVRETYSANYATSPLCMQENLRCSLQCLFVLPYQLSLKKS